MTSFPSRALPYLVWLAITVVWGTTWVVIRIGLQDLSPLLFSAARAALGASVFLAVAVLTAWRRLPEASEIRFWALMGIPQLGLPYALVFWAEQFISSGLTATLFATFPAFTAVTAHLLLRDEPLSWQKMAGTLLAFLGRRGARRPRRWGECGCGGADCRRARRRGVGRDRRRHRPAARTAHVDDLVDGDPDRRRCRVSDAAGGRRRAEPAIRPDATRHREHRLSGHRRDRRVLFRLVLAAEAAGRHAGEHERRRRGDGRGLPGCPGTG